MCDVIHNETTDVIHNETTETCWSPADAVAGDGARGIQGEGSFVCLACGLEETSPFEGRSSMRVSLEGGRVEGKSAVCIFNGKVPTLCVDPACSSVGEVLRDGPVADANRCRVELEGSLELASAEVLVALRV